MTIYDIAKKSGVSIATVSRVLNGSKKVSEQTRARVLAVIDEVGYTPNVFAQGMSLQTMHTVGVLVPTISDIYMARALSFLERGLAECGYECILGCSGFTPEGKRTHTELLLMKHIDALILVGSTYAGDGSDVRDTDYIREAAAQVPVFVINGNVQGDNIYVTVCDDAKAVYETTGGLIAGGRRQLLFLTDSHSYSANHKKSGFERALAEHGLDANGRVLYVDHRVHAVRDMLLSMEGLRSDAVIASSDEIAVGAIKYALARGLRIPEDIEIIGYNNSSFALMCEPELTSIDNCTEAVCCGTVSRVLQLIDRGGEIPQRTEVACELVRRQTTRARVS